VNRWTLYFSVAFVLICAVDYALVAFGYRSISLTFWLAESAHPTLLVGVMLVGLSLGHAAWKANDEFICFTVVGSTFHLGTTEGAAIATMTAARWTHAPTWQWAIIGIAVAVGGTCLIGWAVDRCLIGDPD
jgi:hypothetical protein